MSLDEAFTKSIDAAVEDVVKSMTQESSEPEAEHDDTNQESEEGDGDLESVEDDETVDREDEDRSEQDESGEDRTESETETETDRGENGEAGEKGEEDHGQAGSVEQAPLQFKSPEDLARFINELREKEKVEEKREPEKKSILDEFPELNEEEYDPAVIKSFNAMREVLRRQQEQLDAFEQQQNAVREAETNRTAKELEVWFDDRVATLIKDDEVFEKALGAGSMSKLTPGSRQYQKRNAIAEEMAILAAGHRASGKQIPSRDELFQKAAKLVLEEEYQESGKGRLKGDLQRREKQHINRPTRSKDKARLSPQESVEKALLDKFPDLNR